MHVLLSSGHRTRLADEGTVRRRLKAMDGMAANRCGRKAMTKTIIEPISASYQHEDIRPSTTVCWPDVGSHMPEADRQTR